jgi:integrase
MARLKKGSVPSYRRQKSRNLAVVTIDGRDYYLGPWDTPASKQKYAALIRSWQQQQEAGDNYQEESLRPNDQPTINDLILAYLKHVLVYYKPNHGENKEAGCVDAALKVIQDCGFGREPAETFRPKDLKTVREAMVKKDWSRSYINRQICRVRRMFAFAAEEDLVPGPVYYSLLAVKGLRKGTPGVRETKRIRPVPIDHIKAVLTRAHPVLKAMVLYAYRTGARPGEVCAMKPCHIDRKGKVWVYAVPPEANKTDHHDQERNVYIGPRAQKTLEPRLNGVRPHEFVFSPARAETIRQAIRRESCNTPIWPLRITRTAAKKKIYTKRPKRDHYDDSEREWGVEDWIQFYKRVKEQLSNSVFRTVRLFDCWKESSPWPLNACPSHEMVGSPAVLAKSARPGWLPGPWPWL